MKLFLLSLSTILLLAPATVLAQPKNPDPIKLESFLAVGSLREFIIITIPNILLGLVGMVAIILFFINAIRYLISAGNPEGTTAAKTGMLMAIIGLVVALTAFTIVNTVRGLLGP